jgi:peptidoglycan/LPS O-acetylase OafA/YrhL
MSAAPAPPVTGPGPPITARAAAVLKDGARALWGSGEPRQPALDVLRAASILAVFAQHWPSRFRAGGGVDVGLDKVPPFSVGFAGVDMFFVLSGFLIGRQLWKELAADGTISLRRFFLRRTLRIWPYYFFALLAWSLFHPVENGGARLCEVLFYANYTGIRGIPGSWSLSTEEQFYIVAPLLLLALARRIPLWGFFVVFGLIEAAVIGARYHEVGQLVAAGQRVEYFEPIHLHCDGLLGGMVLSLASVLRPAWFKGEGNAVRGWVVLAAGCIIAFGLYALHRKVYNLASLAILFTALTYALMVDRSFLQKIMAWRVFQIISMLSFGMYLNHFLFMTELGRWWGRATRDLLGPTAAFFLGFGVATVLCTAVAAVTYVLIEHPFLLLRDALLRRLALAPGREARPAP